MSRKYCYSHNEGEVNAMKAIPAADNRAACAHFAYNSAVSSKLQLEMSRVFRDLFSKNGELGFLFFFLTDLKTRMLSIQLVCFQYYWNNVAKPSTEFARRHAVFFT